MIQSLFQLPRVASDENISPKHRREDVSLPHLFSRYQEMVLNDIGEAEVEIRQAMGIWHIDSLIRTPAQLNFLRKQVYRIIKYVQNEMPTPLVLFMRDLSHMNSKQSEPFETDTYYRALFAILLFVFDLPSVVNKLTLNSFALDLDMESFFIAIAAKSMRDSDYLSQEQYHDIVSGFIVEIDADPTSNAIKEMYTELTKLFEIDAPELKQPGDLASILGRIIFARYIEETSSNCRYKKRIFSEAKFDIEFLLKFYIQLRLGQVMKTKRKCMSFLPKITENISTVDGMKRVLDDEGV